MVSLVPIVSRKEAIELKQRLYYTDKPCSNGHKAYRYASNGKCVRCQSEQSARMAREILDKPERVPRPAPARTELEKRRRVLLRKGIYVEGISTDRRRWPRQD